MDVVCFIQITGSYEFRLWNCYSLFSKCSGIWKKKKKIHSWISHCYYFTLKQSSFGPHTFKTEKCEPTHGVLFCYRPQLISAELTSTYYYHRFSEIVNMYVIIYDFNRNSFEFIRIHSISERNRNLTIWSMVTGHIWWFNPSTHFAVCVCDQQMISIFILRFLLVTFTMYFYCHSILFGGFPHFWRMPEEYCHITDALNQNIYLETGTNRHLMRNNKCLHNPNIWQWQWH